MAKRSTISPTKRARIFLNAEGKCHLCNRKIVEGEPWEVEHPKAIGLGGKDDESNMMPAHVDCHAGKTRADVRVMRKADRQMKKHAGIKRKYKWRKRKFGS